MASLSESLRAKIEQWLQWNKNEDDDRRVRQLLDSNEVSALTKAFSKRIKFGTAGLRGVMDVGPANMNDLTIIQTSQGLLEVLKSHNKGDISVVVGCDGRRNSKHFARLAAEVFANGECKVYGFGDNLVPTPLVPFTVKLKNASCGVMITASHNPKNDNGYKVYWSNGAQIISPVDVEIENAILNHLQPKENHSTVDNYNKFVKNIYEEVKNAYLQEAYDVLKYLKYLSLPKPVTMKFTYTAMHGVGYEMVCALFDKMGLPPVIPVVEQCQPDAEFPTVEFPNPEEGESVLDLAMKTAEKHGSKVILANDPDADRLALAYKQSDGHWKVFNGNELGTLLSWWTWMNWRRENPDTDPSVVHMISSTVSSSIMAAMAKHHGFHHHETLTGFKWMGNCAHEIERNGGKVLLAFEEAIGFMCGTQVLDKDGVVTAAVVAEMMIWLDDQGRSPDDQLDVIYSTYGLHMCRTMYLISYDHNSTDSMFFEIRHASNGDPREGDMSYPKKCGPYEIARIRDLTTAKEFTIGEPNSCKKPILPSSSTSQMITFYLKNGSKLTLRTSGTEPKIKCYVEIITPPTSYDGSSKQKFNKEMNDIMKCVVDNFYKPEEHNFIIPKCLKLT